MWAVPALAIALLALVGGVVAAVATAPKPDLKVDIKAAAMLLEKGKYGEALDALNTRVRPLMGGDALTPDDRREFYLLRARALYLGQRELDLDRKENNEAIKGEYASAERLHAALDAKDQYYLAQTLVSLGEWDDAVSRTERLPDAERGNRVALLKRMTDLSLGQKPPNYTRAIDLVTVLLSDPALSADERLWALVRQSEILVSTGYPDDAITKIVRTLPRLEGSDNAMLGELLVTLAKAYMAENDMGESSKQLSRALALVGDESPLVPLITLLQAEIDHHEGELQRARERYTEVIDRYSFADGRPTALLGLAEVLAQIRNVQSTGSIEDSIDRYSELVDTMLGGGGDETTTVDRVTNSLMSRFREEFDRKDDRSALRFADLAAKLNTPDKAPAEVLLGLADAHRLIAADLLREAASGGALSLAEADPATQREAREHLLQAGDAYRSHAEKVVLTDSKAYAQSLWQAGEAYDMAGDLDSSIKVFQRFTQEFPTDQRRPEAVFRLAQAERARGDMEAAAKLFRELIDTRGANDGSGAWGDQSFVPLATTLLNDADPADDKEAESLLDRVVSGEITGPGTPIFRAALRVLGGHYQQTKRYAQAIERLEQYLALFEQAGGAAPGLAEQGVADAGAGERSAVLKRAPDQPGGDGVSREKEAADDEPVRFQLAEAYRASAADIAKQLEGGLPDGLKRDLSQRRAERLTRAGALYEHVKREYEGRKHRTALEDLTLRNAYFYAGDCAFDLRDFDTAIRLYDSARERYPKDPASLVAMTQIVSAFVSQNELAKAAVANQRARRFFESLPESTWDDPTLPMTRANWERWLDAQDVLTRGEGGPRAAAGGGQ